MSWATRQNEAHNIKNIGSNAENFDTIETAAIFADTDAIGMSQDVGGHEEATIEPLKVLESAILREDETKSIPSLLHGMM